MLAFQIENVCSIKFPATLEELLGNFNNETQVVIVGGGGRPLTPGHIPWCAPVPPEKAFSHLVNELADYTCHIHHFEVTRAKGKEDYDSGMDYLCIGTIGNRGSGRMDKNLSYIVLMRATEYARTQKS